MPGTLLVRSYLGTQHRPFPDTFYLGMLQQRVAPFLDRFYLGIPEMSDAAFLDKIYLGTLTNGLGHS